MLNGPFVCNLQIQGNLQLQNFPHLSQFVAADYLVSKDTKFIPSVVTIISFVIRKAFKKLLITDCIHQVMDPCAVPVMQKTGEILDSYKKYAQ